MAETFLYGVDGQKKLNLHIFIVLWIESFFPKKHRISLMRIVLLLLIISSFTFQFFYKTKICRNPPIHLSIFFYQVQICLYFPIYARMKCLNRRKSILNRRIKSLKNVAYFHLSSAEWFPTYYLLILIRIIGRVVYGCFSFVFLLQLFVILSSFLEDGPKK